MNLDLHTHLLPREYLAEVEKRGLSIGFRGMKMGLFSKMHDVDEHIADMDQRGLDKGAISLSPPGVDMADADGSVYLAKVANDGIARLVQEHPDRFTGMAMLPLQRPKEAVKELDRVVNELGMRSVTLPSNVAGKTLDSPELWPVYERAVELDVPLLIHPTEPLNRNGMDDWGLFIVIGFVYDSSIAVIRLVFSGVLERYPNLKIVLAHLGATLPYLLTRIDIETKLMGFIDPKLKPQISKRPSEYIRQIYLDTVSHDQAAYMLAVQMFGADKIVLGSDYPFSAWQHSISEIEELNISQTEKDKILSKNALALLGQ